MKQKQAHIPTHPPPKSPPSGIHRLCPYPQPSPIQAHYFLPPLPRTKGPVFEDACGGGFRSHHRITVGVRGLDASVRCYPLTHIPDRSFLIRNSRGRSPLSYSPTCGREGVLVHGRLVFLF